MAIPIQLYPTLFLAIPDANTIQRLMKFGYRDTFSEFHFFIDADVVLVSITYSSVNCN